MHKPILSALALVCLCAAGAAADPAAPLSALAKMPVKEITVFKDGHAFILHEAKMPVDTAGNVLLDYLPSPVLGTFWPYAANKNAKLSAVVASQRKVLVERTALSLRDMIEGNAGAEVIVTELPPAAQVAPAIYTGTLGTVPTQSGEELEATSPPGTGEKLPVRSNLVVIKTANGDKVVDINRIQDLTFKTPRKAKSATEEFRHLLTLKLDWGKNKADKTADVGLMYLQKGVRWIPAYKVVIDGKGNAAVKLEATLINELTDLEDVDCNLVVGVPTFEFKDVIDPIGLQQVLAQLSENFRQDARSRWALSNAAMSQVAIAGQAAQYDREEAPAPSPPADLGPEIAGSGRSEDLFVYNVKHVTLRKGQRLVLPVAEFKLPYKDAYTLDIPFAPPPEVRGNINTEQQLEMAKLLSAPKVMHKLRLTNKSEYPLTTAPALILRDNRVLAQGLMTYTAIGSEVDLPITAAVDIRVKKTDKETKRTPNAARWRNTDFGKVELAGTIALTNFRNEAVELEVKRSVLGNVAEADHDGKVEMLNVFEEEGFAYPHWWRWYSWPYWWNHFNGIGRITWKFKLEPGKTADLGYTWNYYWE